MKVINLSDEVNNGKMRTPIDALYDAVEEFTDGELKGRKKVLIIPLDDLDEAYNVSFIQAGMSMSECLAVIEVAKTVLLNEMGY